MADHTRSRFLLPAAALALAAALAFAAICGQPVQQQAGETATAEGTVAAGDTHTPNAATTDAVTPAETATPGSSPSATPVATPTTPSVFGFPEQAELPPSGGPDAPMFLTGIFWIDARPASGLVTAYIGGTLCGEGRTVTLETSSFIIEVSSASLKPGCGVDGAPVELRLDNRVANETVPWRASYQQPLNIVAGPPFAQ